MTTRVQIAESPDQGWSVKIDGLEFAHRIASGSLTLDIGQPNSVSKVGLSLIATVEAEFTGVVQLSDTDEQMLLSIGWKHPNDEAWSEGHDEA